MVAHSAHFDARTAHDVDRDPVAGSAFAQARDVGSTDGIATVVSVVYVTASATFAGPTASFVTQGIVTATTPAPTTPTMAPVSFAPDTPTTQTKTQTSSSKDDRHTSSTKSDVRSSLSSASSTTTQVPSVVVGTPLAASRTGLAGQTSMSSGAKAGLAIGLILAFSLLAGVAFLFSKKRQKSRGLQKMADDEKSITSLTPPRHSPARAAPRLSLGPNVLPYFSDTRSPAVATNTTGGLVDDNAIAPENRLTVFPSSAALAVAPSNPFGRDAETSPQSAEDFAAENAPIPVLSSAGSNPFADSNASPFNKSPSPEFDASAIEASTGSRGAQSNVHRVQLNFQPSMDDELELRAGQVVRIMHEYDDGWALCMRMDRSKQGVAPRTCLSKMPIKPRHANPPPLRPSGQQGSSAAGRQPSFATTYPGSIAPTPGPLSSTSFYTQAANNDFPPSIMSPLSPQQYRRRSLDQTQPTSLHSAFNDHSSPRFRRRSSSVGPFTPGSPPTSPNGSRLARKPVGGVPGAAR